MERLGKVLEGEFRFKVWIVTVSWIMYDIAYC